ncbi:MAG: tRNA (adenosine(37)-N6)-threonylcarbamoyltransferase complex ATPase subunit type 1 TsaE [Gemmatimonadaceae bacterium]
MTTVDARLTRTELDRWGEAFGRLLVAGTVVTLSGDLGAGKTTLAQAICRGYGTTDDVTSPTFALVHEYAAPHVRSAVYHLDLYRLQAPRDLVNLGFDDMLDSGAVVLIEWPERAGSWLPAGHVQIRLEHVEGDAGRRHLMVG